MKTYQDFLKKSGSEQDKKEFILEAISDHKQSGMYNLAADAEEYAHQRNSTIMNYQKLLYTVSGKAVPDNYSANYKLCSNFFDRFITQENQYLLGNGVTLEKDDNKKKLGKKFDQQLQKAGRDALVEGVSFGFWNYDHLESYKLTEFVPLYDEETGALMGGIRFWQLEYNKPLRATLFELDGYTDYIKKKNEEIKVLNEKRNYKQIVTEGGVDGTIIRDGGNYPSFPIIPLWASPQKQSCFVGMKQNIDAYDLIKSGFANDLDDASMIYWTIQNAGGMDDISLAQFVERMKTVRAASIDADAGAKAEAHTMDVPYQSRVAYLERLENDLYNDFQALNVKSLQGGQKTATEIAAAYQPFDNKVDQYEYCVLDFLDELFKLVGIEDNPTFKRSRVVNQLEETQIILAAAQYLDDETILKHLPFLTPDEVYEIQKRKAEEDLERFNNNEPTEPPGDEQ